MSAQKINSLAVLMQQRYQHAEKNDVAPFLFFRFLLIQLYNLFYFCIKIDLLQSANLLTTNFA
jgi:hypothetical protein